MKKSSFNKNRTKKICETFTELRGVSIEHLQWMWHADGTITPLGTWSSTIMDSHMFCLLLL